MSIATTISSGLTDCVGWVTLKALLYRGLSMITIAMLRECGASDETIARVCERLEQEQIATARERIKDIHERDRINSRAYRQRKKLNKINTVVRAVRADASDAPFPQKNINEINGRVRGASSDDPSILTESLNQTIESKTRLESLTPDERKLRQPAAESEPSKPSTRRKSRLPTDAQLTDKGRDFAHGKGFTDVRIAQEWARFVDHAQATGRLQLDWEAAWRMWITSPFQQKGSSYAGQRPRPFSFADNQEQVRAASARLADYARGSGGADQATFSWLPKAGAT